MKLTQKKQVLCDLQVFFLIFNCQTPEAYNKNKLYKELNDMVYDGDTEEALEELNFWGVEK